MAANFDGLPNLYEALRVHPKAEMEVIKAAYKALMQIAHPDKGGTQERASLLTGARDTLLDTKTRSEYDKFLHQQNQGLLGNYRILDQIGEGAFGYTYKARHVILEEYACLKQNIHLSPEDSELLRQEARTLWGIHHHSLPTVREFFKQSDGSCVLAMSYIDGVSLDKTIEKHGKIPTEQVCAMTQRLLNALNYLQHKGIVHCDVKPNNIIVQPTEHNATLVDYGFASVRPGKKTTPIGLTQAFAAPELFYEKPPVAQTDLYSLAKTCIYALGGDPIKDTYPKNTPEEIKGFFNQFLVANPLHRPSWKKRDFVMELSTLREKVFGRKQSQEEWIS